MTIISINAKLNISRNIIEKIRVIGQLYHLKKMMQKYP